MKKTVTLREARAAAGWTMAELARRSDVGESAIAAIEAGRMPGNLITRHRLADALGVPFRVMWPDSMKEIAELQEAFGRDAAGKKNGKAKS